MAQPAWLLACFGRQNSRKEGERQVAAEGWKDGGFTATVHAHVRVRLRRQAVNLLGRMLRNPAPPPTSRRR
ncbi:hypothetical protein E6R62_27990 [Streptomyces sp. A1136]|nr:hypothetical protein E6R62_27990 [Streptomyces sp. A1136]